MANEPNISLEGYAFKIKRFNDGGTVATVCVTPSRLDKQTNQWVDLETMYFDVSIPSKNQRMLNTANDIERYLQGNESVRVFVEGALSETKGSQGGNFKRVYPRRLYLLSHKPKGQSQATGFNPNMQQSTAFAPAPAGDPWAQTNASDGFSENVEF